MASFINKLRMMVGFKPTEEETGREKTSAFQTLSAQFLACEDETLKAQLWDQMCKALPDTLFLCAMCFEGENPNMSARDKVLHATVGAERLYKDQQQVVTKGNPGYRLTDKKDKRRMHLRTLVYQKTKEEWVPLFTDFTEYLPVFGQNSRVTIISFKEAYQMARANTGIIINPGKDAIRLDNSQMKNIL